MKKSVFAVALLAAMMGSVQAADVQMYGRVDLGLKYTDYKGGDDTLEMRNGRSTSRIGFNIVEDLGNGYKVKGYLETGFKADEGTFTTSGSLFDRRSILAIQGPWGEIGAGRAGTVHSTMAPYSMGLIKFDPFGTSYGNASIGTTFLNSSRVNNSLHFRSASMNGWQVGGSYSFGNSVDDVEYTDSDHTAALALTYTGENVYMTLTAANIKYGDGKTVSYLVDPEDEESEKTHAVDYKDARMIALGGWIRLQPEWRLFAGVQYQRDGRRGAKLKVSAFDKSTGETNAALLSHGYTGYSALLGMDYVTGPHKIIAGAQYFDGEIEDVRGTEYKRTVLAAAYEYYFKKNVIGYVAATGSFVDGKASETFRDENTGKNSTELFTGLNILF